MKGWLLSLNTARNLKAQNSAAFSDFRFLALLEMTVIMIAGDQKYAESRS